MCIRDSDESDKPKHRARPTENRRDDQNVRVIDSFTMKPPEQMTQSDRRHGSKHQCWHPKTGVSRAKIHQHLQMLIGGRALQPEKRNKRTNDKHKQTSNSKPKVQRKCRVTRLENCPQPPQKKHVGSSGRFAFWANPPIDPTCCNESNMQILKLCQPPAQLRKFLPGKT